MANSGLSTLAELHVDARDPGVVQVTLRDGERLRAALQGSVWTVWYNGGAVGEFENLQQALQQCRCAALAR